MKYQSVFINPDGSGDFRSLCEAAATVPRHIPVRFLLAPGIYRERPFLEFDRYCLVGAGMGKTILTADAAARDLPDDGQKRGTFRSQTLFLGGECASVSDLTVRNTAGDGAICGQALAVYADAASVTMRSVSLEGNQDTLFTAPLPIRERETGGFRGPREFAPRRPTRQYYRDCRISGNIDFIFGGADAVFDHCRIIPLAHKTAQTYVCAPSTPEGEPGYLFVECEVHGSCPEGSVYLGRPWREHGEAIWLNCCFSEELHPDVWNDWNRPEDRATARFCVIGNQELHPAFGLPPTRETEQRAWDRVNAFRKYFSEDSNV